jgi:hypothetical protein
VTWFKYGLNKAEEKIHGKENLRLTFEEAETFSDRTGAENERGVSHGLR